MVQAKHRDGTHKYIEENQYVHSLPVSTVHWGNKRRIVGWSVFELMRLHIASLIWVVPRYAREIWTLRGMLLKSFQLRGTNSNRRSLVIGNGPSKGMLNFNELNEFKVRGGVTYCINNWASDISLSRHIPSWIVLSDPDTFKQGEDSRLLIAYILRNSSINLLIPSTLLNEVRHFEFKNKVFCFVDTELLCFRSTNPLLPRGYLSMTLYKALAWAQYLGGSEIGIIGMDNTYPRNVFCDSRNNTIILKTYAGREDVAALWQGYSVGAYVDESVRLFRDLEFFDINNVVNLDPYSLTDRFRKISIAEFFNREPRNSSHDYGT